MECEIPSDFTAVALLVGAIQQVFFTEYSFKEIRPSLVKGYFKAFFLLMKS